MSARCIHSQLHEEYDYNIFYNEFFVTLWKCIIFLEKQKIETHTKKKTR